MEQEFNIKIIQTLEGHVSQRGDTRQAALNKAYEKYAVNGHELPDMEDTQPLKFEIEESKPLIKAPSRDEVIDWFQRNGQSEPYEGWIENFISPLNEDRKEQYWEAIALDYELFEFDRWQHFQDVIKHECSYDCYLTCSNALWKEDIEVLELGPKETNVPQNADYIYHNVANQVVKTQLAGECATWDEMCVEYPLTGFGRDGHSLVVYGEVSDENENYFIISIHKTNKDDSEKILLNVYTENAGALDLKDGIFRALQNFDENFRAAAPALNDKIKNASGNSTNHRPFNKNETSREL